MSDVNRNINKNEQLYTHGGAAETDEASNMDVDEINKAITQHNRLTFILVKILNDHDFTNIEVRKKIFARVIKKEVGVITGNLEVMRIEIENSLNMRSSRTVGHKANTQA